MHISGVRPSRFDDNVPVKGTPMVEHTTSVLDAIFEHRSESIPGIKVETTQPLDSAEIDGDVSAPKKTTA